MHAFKSSLLADEDIISIYAYTLETWGSDQLEIYQAKLDRARNQILEDPFLAGSQSREDLAPGCRLFRVEHHYFPYRLNDSTVEIARVLHENMDFHVQMRADYFP
ncbi:MAG: type II toxin-antitoxin system RelE/ParE family toxin [Akkermansiaceae bacterium]|jgi:toxin ParE1/3/4